MKNKQPLVFILFGATGDLALRKILPALVETWKREKSNLLVVAFSRRPWNDEEYRNFVRPVLKEKGIGDKILESFLKQVVYVSGTFDDPEGYKRLHQTIIAHEKKHTKKLNVVAHFAIEPEFYGVVAKGMGKVGLGNKVKIMLEKPFGSDGRSAKKVRNELEKFFPEKKIYHVDHYLAKKGLRTLMSTRFKNKNLEAQLNNKHVAKVNLYLNEAIGIEDRGRFYDRVGTIRDVGQNHMMEMLLAAAMDIQKKSRQKTRSKTLEALKFKNKKSFVQGQYEGYLQEEGVNPNSTTETAFRFELELNLPRWRGTKFVFESGKNLKEHKGVEFEFKDGTKRVFLMEKTETGHADAYKILIEKVFAEDQSYFVGINDIAAQWKIIDAVLRQKKTTPLTTYKKGMSTI